MSSAVARYGDDDSRRRHLQDAEAARVGDEQAARRVHGDSNRIREEWGSRKIAVAPNTEGSAARHGAGDTTGCHLLDSLVAGIGDEQIARRVHGDARWT